MSLYEITKNLIVHYEIEARLAEHVGVVFPLEFSGISYVCRSYV